MDSGITKPNICPLPEISAYLDGELCRNDESLLEHHLSECRVCSAELQEQKLFFNSLGSSLKDESFFELPKDFSKKVITVAESHVTGFTYNKDIFLTAVICLFLVLSVLLVSAAQGGQTSFAIFNFFERTSAIALMSMAVVYNISYGIAVILRSLTKHEGGIVTTVSILLVCSAAMVLFAKVRAASAENSSSD